jgi:hypothetical protein
VNEVLSKRAMEALRLMRDEDEEIVQDRLAVYVGSERFGPRTVTALLRVMAVKDVSDGAGMQRYVINDAGLGILERPELADEITVALLGGRPFMIRDNRVVPLPPQENE